jgi:hypothetical protein
MKQVNRLAKNKRGQAQHAASMEICEVEGFGLFASAPTAQVPYQTIHEFIQTVPHTWSLDDIDRFGYRATRMAFALQLAIVRGHNADVGELRVFPVAFLEWVYTKMARECRWPSLTDAQASAEGRVAQRLELRRRERAAVSLQELSEGADNVEVLTSIEKVREFVNADIARLRTEIEAPLPAPASAASAESN